MVLERPVVDVYILRGEREGENEILTMPRTQYQLRYWRMALYQMLPLWSMYCPYEVVEMMTLFDAVYHGFIANVCHIGMP